MNELLSKLIVLLCSAGRFCSRTGVTPMLFYLDPLHKRTHDSGVEQC